MKFETRRLKNSLNPPQDPIQTRNLDLYPLDDIHKKHLIKSVGTSSNFIKKVLFAPRDKTRECFNSGLGGDLGW